VELRSERVLEPHGVRDGDYIVMINGRFSVVRTALRGKRVKNH
jgi:hypothetical protein